MNTKDKIGCQEWCTDGRGGYQRVLGDEINHIVGKERTQQLELTKWYCGAANRSMAIRS